MQFGCAKCGKLLGYDDYYERNEDGSLPPLGEIRPKKEPRCIQCGWLILDPFRKCRRLIKLSAKKLNMTTEEIWNLILHVDEEEVND